MRLSVRVRAQNALSRDVPRPECAFPSRRGAREVWGNPPARLRGTMENGSTGQMRSSNPPPACGAGCTRVRKSRFGVWPHGKAHSARPAGFRMRLSVECAFPHLGKRGAASRKSALWPNHLTEKRTLQPTQPQQCTQMPQNGAEGPFLPICVHSLSPRPLVRPGRATGPTTSTALWPP